MLATSEIPLTESPARRRLRSITEGLLIGMCSIAPWLFGAVDAWAELVLCLLIVVVSLLGMILQITARSVTLSVPSFALAGLILFGIAQQTSIPRLASFFSTYKTSNATLTLFPEVPERLISDPSRMIETPSPTVSVNPEGTRLAVARLMAGWVLFETVTRLDAPYLVFRRFGLMTVVNSCLLSVYAMIQWLTWNGRIYRIRLSPHPDLAWYSGGPFICHNHLAAYLNLGFGFSIGMLLAALKGDPWFGRRRGQRYWPVLIAGLILAGLVISHSRGGVLAAMAAASVLLVTQRLRLGRSLLAFVFLALTALTVLLATGSETPWARLSTLANSSEDVRWNVWRVAIHAWSLRPFLGWGLGTFGFAVTPFTDKDVHAFYQRGENQYIDLLVEGGIVGLGLGLTVIGFTIANARRALSGSRLAYERAFLAGGIFGGVGLLLHWMTDFSFHIPAVSVSVIVLAALVCRLGWENGGSWALVVPSRLLNVLVRVALPAAVCAMVVTPAIRNTKVEALLFRAGLPLPDSFLPEPAIPSHAPGDLRDQIQTLDRALSLRPDWAEGYLRRGLAYLELYQVTAGLWLKQAEPNLKPSEAFLMSDPLWLRITLLERSKSPGSSITELLNQEPIQQYLVPAAESFLQARRCCKVLALANMECANLHYLLRTTDPSSVYIQRAFALAGASPSVLVITGKLANEDGDIDTMKKCWRRALEVNPEVWVAVAAPAMSTLTPEQILSDVIPPDQGRLALFLATGFEGTKRSMREALLNGALEMIPHDVTLDPADVKYQIAMTYYQLGQTEDAVNQLVASLRLAPKDTSRRLALIQWLSELKAWKEARLHANLGLQLQPNEPNLLGWQRLIIERIAQGDKPSDEMINP